VASAAFKGSAGLAQDRPPRNARADFYFAHGEGTAQAVISTIWAEPPTAGKKDAGEERQRWPCGTI